MRKFNPPPDESIKQAIECILSGESLIKTSRKTGLSIYTIKKYYAEYTTSLEATNPGIRTTPHRRRKPKTAQIADTVFTSDQLDSLIESFKYFSSKFYGLSEKECRILAYQKAIMENLRVPVSWKRGMASVEWLQRFKNSHSDLGLERPDRCSGSTARSIVWEKKNVNKFYDDYEILIQMNPVFQNSSRIFSLDETCTSTSPVNKIVNVESKQLLITTCAIVRADGNSLPPVIVKPLIATEYNTDSEISFETLILTETYGRLTSDLFMKVMQHFVNYSNSSLDNPSILIMDIDLCHLSLPAFSLAKTAGVQILTLHPHSAKKLQPLAMGLLDLFDTHYYDEFYLKFKEWEKISKETPETFSLFDWPKCIDTLVDGAYTEAMTPQNIQNAFKQCGILPYDRDLFTDSDYQSCVMMDQPCEVCKARDDRCRRWSVSEDPAPVIDEDSRGSSNDAELVVLEKAVENTLDNVDTSISPKISPPPQSDRPEMSPKARGAELDKLKRRMIRTVARLLKEKKTEDEVFEELKKESGTNCRNLWERMRSLTMKKLKRLLDAHDRIDHVPAVARMSLTDWLLYDLVIVHEKIDVIDRKAKTSTVMNNLFSLVQMFSIEGRSGDDLAEAWTVATVNYNSRGHQCSPMLMQRRWYQIKELTRHKMYKFWFNYRGNQRLLHTAKQDAPTELQKAIALRYPEIITAPFPEWEERIERKLVIMPEEFEVKMRNTNMVKPSDDTADVVIVEKQIDTICLEDTDSEDCDEENSRESTGTTSINPMENSYVNNVDNNELQTPIIVQVKTEPKDPYANINMTDTNYQPPSEEPYDRFQDEIERLKMEEDKILTDEEDTEFGAEEVQNDGLDLMMPLITNVVGGIDTKVEDAIQDDASVSETEHEDIENNLSEAVDVEKEETTQNNTNSNKNILIIENNLGVVIENQIEKTTQNETSVGDNLNAPIEESILIDDDDSDEEIIRLENIAKEQNVTNPNVNETIDITSRETNTTTKEHLENSNSEAIVENTVFVEPAVKENDFIQTNEIANEILLEDSEESENDVITLARQCSEGILGEEKIHSMEQDVQQPNNSYISDEILSDMNFADDGIEFADDGIEYNEDNEDQNGSASHENFGSRNENEGNCNPKFDLKLLMNPIVYTTKVDEMTVYKERPLFDTIEEKDLIDKIIFESKPTSANPVKAELVTVKNYDPNDIDGDIVENDSSDESDSDVIMESKKVKLSSNLLQKPRSRSYHPIQLCKNPDFNTRLKRLTVGFFSSTRNRVLLKACKPMTIDLSKSFESKLLNGTMYLKPSDPTVKIEENVTESTVSILPSTVAVQSLMDNPDVDKILQEELKKRMLERNKNISLPNISIVRQINQHLLMAEVAPIMAQIENTALTDYANSQENITTVEKEKVLPFDNDAKRLNPYVMTALSNEAQSQNIPPTARDECPVNVDTYTNTFETKNSASEKPRNVDKESQPVAESSKSKLEKALEKQKKIKERQKNMNMPSWLTKSSESKTSAELLLTIDTLYKMLNALDPCKEYSSKLNKPKVKSKLKKPDRVPDTRIKKVATPQEVVPPKIRMVNMSLLKKVSSTQATKRRKNCCWAKYKIEKLALKSKDDNSRMRFAKHRCPAQNCRCCCKVLLRQVEIDMEVRILEHIQNSSVDDDLTLAIENVVQQIRDVPEVIEQPAVHMVNVDQNAVIDHLPPVKISVDVGLQADLDEHDEVTVPETNQPELHDIPVDAQVAIDVDQEDENVSQLSNIQPPTPVLRVYSASPKNVASTAPQLRDQKKNKRTTNKTPIISPIAPKIMPLPKTKPVVSNNIIALPSKYKLYSKEPEENFELAPCSCQTNITEQSLSMLLVDGTNDCPQHGKTRVSKETRIYLNRKNMSITERPFYVGKNKILLTNVKQPKAPQEPAQITLPDGVQVVLLPDGSITYLLDPNIELTPQQTEAMPAILSAIMRQIKASGITLPATNLQETGEIINLDQDDVNPKPIETIDQPNLQPLVSQEPSSDAANIISEVAKVTSDGEEQTLPVCETHVNNEENIAKDTQAPDVNVNKGPIAGNEHNYASPEKIEAVASTGSVESNSAAATSSRNLLSDLMEMSGIVEEDIAPTHHTYSIVEPSTIPVDTLIQPLPFPIPELSSTQPGLIPVPALSPFGKRKHSISAQIDEKVHELNPINSFAALKYACDNDGLFFKLDITTGVIVPINVCIQKTPSESAGVKTSFTSTEVIDLTDEQGVSINEQSTNSTKVRNTSKIMPRQISTMMPASSSKDKSILKVTHPPYHAQRNTIDQKKKELLSRLSNNLKPLILRNSTQAYMNVAKKNLLSRLNKIEAKIDLVDSDGPMEEEYLVEDSSDDSSDDEPLAKKAKKYRQDNDSLLELTHGSENSQESQAQMVLQSDEVIDFEEAIDAIESVQICPSVIDKMVPVPTQLVLTGGALNQPILLNEAYLAANDADDDDSQEDCILGV